VAQNISRASLIAVILLRTANLFFLPQCSQFCLKKNLLKNMRDAGLSNLQANCVAIRGNRSDAAHRIAAGKCVNGYFRQQRVPVEQMAQPIPRAPERNTRVVAAEESVDCDLGIETCSGSIDWC